MKWFSVNVKWNCYIYAITVPTLECFAGIKPMAHKNYVVIEPNIPKAMGDFCLYNIKISNSIIDFEYKKGEYTITINGDINAELLQNGETEILKSGINRLKKKVR